MITLVVGTNRPESKSSIVASTLKEKLESHGQDSQVLNLTDLPKDFIFSDMYGSRSEEFQKIVDQFIIGVDKFIFVIPEYNGGFPGVLKSFIDCVEPALMNHKKAALIGVSSGRAGGLRAMDQFTNVLNYLKVNVHFNKPPLSKIQSLLSEDKRIIDPETLAIIDLYCRQVIEF